MRRNKKIKIKSYMLQKVKRQKKLRTSFFVALCLSIPFFVISNIAFALPQGGQVEAGGVSIHTPTPSTMQINQTTQKGIINWQKFNIGAQEHVNFQQPNQSSITLNRVNPHNGTSEIFGKLTANGQVWLVNPAGIWFAPGSYVSVGGLLATTADIRSDDFMNGQYRFQQSPDWNYAVENEGTIVVRENGLAALVAPSVVNKGKIIANMGTVVLGASKKYTVDFNGDQLINFEVGGEVNDYAKDRTGKKLSSAVTNSGSVIAHGGKVVITAKAAGKVLDNTINMSGVVEAKTVGVRNGEIILGASGGTIHFSGKAIAKGGKAQRGGRVKVIAKKIYVKKNAEIDVSGDTGGGEILIGGNAYGQGPEEHAMQTYIDVDAKLSADAISQGDGGKIIVWSDGETYAYGSFSARGGELSGNGGFIETSGHYLDIAGIKKVDLSAPKGKTGTWLLDPTDINIVSAPPTAGADYFSGGTFNPTTSGSGASTIYAGDIGAQLNSASVLIRTTNPSGTGNGDIIFNDPGNTLQASWTSNSTTLTLQADRHITFSSALTLNGSGKTLTLTAGQTNAAGSITINSTMNGFFNLNLTRGASGSTNINAGLGQTTALLSLTSNNATNIGTNIRTLNGQTYSGTVTLTGSSIIQGSTIY